jgi:hypothetical protein
VAAGSSGVEAVVKGLSGEAPLPQPPLPGDDIPLDPAIVSDSYLLRGLGEIISPSRRN